MTGSLWMARSEKFVLDRAVVKPKTNRQDGSLEAYPERTDSWQADKDLAAETSLWMAFPSTGDMPMPLDHWFAFVAASVVMLAIPGPTVLLVISYALGHGRRPAAAIVAGVALGDFTGMTASMLGLGAILAASAVVFTALRWAGGAYLVYLGVKLWRAPVGPAVHVEAPTTSLKNMFAHAYAVTALNPKGIVFFVAFVPQFLVTSQPYLPQVVILETTFVTLAVLNTATYAFLASAARRRLREPRVRRAMNRSGGALLVGAGALAAGWRGAST